MNDFDYHRTVIAYHGCDLSVRQGVLEKNGKLKASENRYDWLGRGVYFWEHGPRRALDWATQRAHAGSENIKTPAVLGAVVHLGKCFDLLDTANTQLLAKLFPAFERAQAIAGKVLPRNKAPKDGDPHELVLRELDCAMINWAMAELEEAGLVYDTVRCAFSEGVAAFSGSKIQLQSHIQLAVRNPAVIVGYFLPSQSGLDEGGA